MSPGSFGLGFALLLVLLLLPESWDYVHAPLHQGKLGFRQGAMLEMACWERILPRG